MQIPDPRYVRTEDGVYIAYQVVGEGSVDISLQHAWLGGLELMWEDPYVSASYEQLGAFSRLILHDRRATGLSSRNVRPPNLETRVDDLLTVLDAVDSHGSPSSPPTRRYPPLTQSATRLPYSSAACSHAK